MNAEVIPQSTEIVTQSEPVNKRELANQMDVILRIADFLEKGVRGTTQLMRETGLSRPTVIKYRNEALKVIRNENKQMNSEALRQMEIGRLNYWIDWIQKKVESLSDSKEDREHLNKLLGRLDNMQGRLHAITGLNTTVNVNYEEKKRITFIMKGQEEAGQSSTLEAQPKADMIEAELVQSTTT